MDAIRKIIREVVRRTVDDPIEYPEYYSEWLKAQELILSLRTFMENNNTPESKVEYAKTWIKSYFNEY